VDVHQLLELGVTGPLIRAAGIPWDIRVNEPYSSYEKFDVKIAVHQNGDVYDRYRVRMDEFRDSCRIAKAALEGMLEGSFKADAPKVVLPDREQMKTQMESLIH